MNDELLRTTIKEFRSGEPVCSEIAEPLFDGLIASKDEILLTEILLSWNEKGVTEDELFEFGSIMRRRMRILRTDRDDLVDIVGTGGSSAKTFNVSTAAAFVVAGAGVAVAKHGNRAATSSSGSSDVLSQLGIDVDVQVEKTEENLSRFGLCFMFAPRFHSLSPALANARRSLGQPTIFNCLGPLCNPARAGHQVIGVRDRRVNKTMAKVLSRLGTRRSWVVTGENGLDEISLGKTTVSEVSGSDIRTVEITAADFGVESGGEIPANCNAEQSAEMILKVLRGQMQGEAAERLVLINAAAAIYVAGNAENLVSAREKAEESIRNGAALAKLAALSSKY